MKSLYLLLIILVSLSLKSCTSSSGSKSQKGEGIYTQEQDTNFTNKKKLNIAIFYNTTDYYVYQGITKGFQYDLVNKLAKYLNLELNIKYINPDLKYLFNELKKGNCDIAAMNLTKTQTRLNKFKFSDPLFSTQSIILQNKHNKPIHNLKDLNKKTIFIVKDASSLNLLNRIKDSLKIKFRIIEMPQPVSFEDLLYSVNSNKIKFTVLDGNIINAHKKTMNNLVDSFVLAEKVNISWAISKRYPALAPKINNWIKLIKKNGELNFLYNKYFKNIPHHSNYVQKYAAITNNAISQFDKLFKHEANIINWDWRLLAAIAYEESEFNPDAESSFGAFGLMQIMPETASQYHIVDYFRPDSNIVAGRKFLSYLDKFFSKYPIKDSERIKFILASYNAGPGHIIDAMRLAKKYKKDQYIWDNNVDYFVKNKSKPKYYKDPLSRNGYCNGKQAYEYVKNVLSTYKNYKNINL